MSGSTEAPCLLPCSTGSCTHVWIPADSVLECDAVSDAIGCGQCKPPTVSLAILASLNRTGSVTLCPSSILHADGPYDCQAPYQGMWCEQALTAGSWLHQAQPMNVITSLAGPARSHATGRHRAILLSIG